LKNELPLVEKSFEECRKKRQEEKERLHSIKRETEECSKELGNLKKDISYVEWVNEAQWKLQEEIVECEKVLEMKEEKLSWEEDLIGELEQELKTKETKFHNID
jgi:chromosome segregation ATPase